MKSLKLKRVTFQIFYCGLYFDLYFSATEMYYGGYKKNTFKIEKGGFLPQRCDQARYGCVRNFFISSVHRS